MACISAHTGPILVLVGILGPWGVGLVGVGRVCPYMLHLAYGLGQREALVTAWLYGLSKYLSGGLYESCRCVLNSRNPVV